MQRPKLTAAQHATFHAEWTINGDPQILDALCVDFASVATSLCRKVRPDLKGADADEAIDEGQQAVLRAIRRFEPGRGTKLSSYVYASVLRSVSTYRRPGAIHVPRGESYPDLKAAALQTAPLEAASANATPVNRLDGMECLEIGGAIDRLADRDRDVIRDLFFEDMTVAEVAIKYQLTKAQVMHARDRGLGTLRRRLSDYAPSNKKSEK